MKTKNNSKDKKDFPWYILLILVLISSILFIFSNPNFLIKKGLGFLAWIYYVPVLILISKAKLKHCWIYGFFYGLISYGVYAFWMTNAYLLGYSLIILYFGFNLAILFTLLKLIDCLFEKEAWIVQCLLICAYEYVRTLGFLGFSYGITAYTQWNYKVIIQICDLFGIFGLNVIMIFFSGIIYSYGKKQVMKRNMLFQKQANQNNISRYLDFESKKKQSSLKMTGVITILISFLIIFDLVYGFIKIKENTDYKTLKICAVQSLDNPFSSGFDAYENNVRNLKKLTDEALELYPDLDMVVWPETAVVPAIVYNYEANRDQKRYELSKSLLRYIDSKNVQFVIGNGHKVKEHNLEVKNYNAALVFNPGENVIPPKPYVYAKNHLVPFTENFPFKKHLSFTYKMLLKSGHVIWTPGSSVEVFENKELKFSTPICFEDTFGNVCRQMVQKGARAFVNLTNDSWANSVVCQNQHLAMGIIRSVENRVPTVRCTNSGETCIINSKGVITNQLTSFISSYMIGEIDVIENNYKPTLYSKVGDYAGLASVILLLFVLIMKIILVKIK